MPNCCQNGNGSPSQVLPGRGAGRLNTDVAPSVRDRGSPRFPVDDLHVPFFAFSGAKDASMGSVRLASKRPKKGRFWALSAGASNRPVQRTRNCILRVEIHGHENIPENIPGGRGFIRGFSSCAQGADESCPAMVPSGDVLSPTADGRFFAFSRGKDVSPGFRSACIETPQIGPFLGLIGWRIETPAKHAHARVSCAWNPGFRREACRAGSP